MRPTVSTRQIINNRDFKAVDAHDNWVIIRRIKDECEIKFYFGHKEPVEACDFDKLVFSPAWEAENTPEGRMDTVVKAFLHQNRNYGDDFAAERAASLRKQSHDVQKRREPCGGCGLITDQTLTSVGWVCGCCSKVWPS